MSIRAGEHAVMPSREIRTYVDPGDVQIVAELDGKRFDKTLTARAGARLNVEIPALGSGDADRDATGGKRKMWLVASASLGVAGVGGMTVSALLTLSASRRYADAFAEGECFHTPRGAECTAAGLSRVDSARSRANLATGVFIGSVAVIGGAIATYLLAPRDSIEVAPAATTDSASVTISGRF
jgi:hypothetical protein